MVMKGYTSKKVCDWFGCRWVTIKSKRQIPIEQSLKRMKLRKGGTIKEEYIDKFYELLMKAKRGEITQEDLQVLKKIMRDNKKKRKRKLNL